jgi:H+/Cl- antiporter ClcA
MPTPSSPLRRLRLLALALATGLATGGACAAFLWGLERATALQGAHGGLLLLLPAWGWVLGRAGETVGRASDPGMALVLSDLSRHEGRVPLRLLPHVVLGTLGTHLFGGSSGREGAAVQAGAAVASAAARWARLHGELARLLLAAGAGGGFGALFGTPLAGALFALEVGAGGTLRLGALGPALLASYAGDAACRALGGVHAHWAVQALPLSAASLGAVALTGVASAAAAATYVRAVHALSGWSRARIPHGPLRLALGGAAVVLAALLLDGRPYLGLGLPLLESALSGAGAPVDHAFAAKLAFTALTVGVGFKGGEVTPLLASGALLGATLGQGLGVEGHALAAVGLAAMFAAASGVPLASLVMGMELFGTGLAWPLAVGCAVASMLASRQRCLYPAAGAGDGAP